MQVAPTHAIVAVTDRCNARCSMCNIWKRAAGPELPADAFGSLPTSLREINVTGGEPLLRRDLAGVIGVLRQRCPRARIVLSTNGLVPSGLRDLLAEVRGIAVRVSVDGIGETHDLIRGVSGAFDRALESVEVCRAAGVRDLGIAATVSRQNAGKVGEVYDLARRLGVEFSVTVAHSSPIFFGDVKGEEPDGQEALPDLARIRSRLFASSNPKDWFKAYFLSGLVDVLKGRPRPIACHAGRDFFYMDARGDVYPCHLMDLKMGSILDQPYARVAEASKHVPAAVGACTKRCWMTCTVAPEIRRRLPEYLIKIIVAKALHHLGVFRSK